MNKIKFLVPGLLLCLASISCGPTNSGDGGIKLPSGGDITTDMGSMDIPSLDEGSTETTNSEETSSTSDKTNTEDQNFGGDDLD